MRLPRFPGFDVAAVVWTVVLLAPLARGADERAVTRVTPVTRSAPIVPASPVAQPRVAPEAPALAPVAGRPEEDSTAMVDAALARDWKNVKELLAAGADPKVANDT